MRKSKIQKLNEEIQKVDTNKISDGYHTFEELYDHRITLFVALCNTLMTWQREKYGEASWHPLVVWKSKKHSDNSVMKGWFVAGIGLEKGKQITYHLPINRWNELKSIELEKAPEWDKHSPADVLERIKKYLY